MSDRTQRDELLALTVLTFQQLFLLRGNGQVGCTWAPVHRPCHIRPGSKVACELGGLCRRPRLSCWPRETCETANSGQDDQTSSPTSPSPAHPDALSNLHLAPSWASHIRTFLHSHPQNSVLPSFSFPQHMASPPLQLLRPKPLAISPDPAPFFSTPHPILSAPPWKSRQDPTRSHRHLGHSSSPVFSGSASAPPYTRLTPSCSQCRSQRDPISVPVKSDNPSAPNSPTRHASQRKSPSPGMGPESPDAPALSPRTGTRPHGPQAGQLRQRQV